MYIYIYTHTHTGTVEYATTKDATTNECYNEQFYQWNQDATTNDPTKNKCYNEEFNSIKSDCYNEWSYKERMLQRRV